KSKPAGHDSAQRPALRIVKTRAGERRELGLSDELRTVKTYLCDRVVMRERDINRVFVSSDACRRRAADGLSARLDNLRAQAQFRRERWMLAIAHVVCPERAAAV